MCSVHFVHTLCYISDECDYNFQNEIVWISTKNDHMTLLSSFMLIVKTFYIRICCGFYWFDHGAQLLELDNYSLLNYVICF